MKRRIIKTEDGSHTIFVPELGEHYHSIHGAVRESGTIFIEAGFNSCDRNPLNILEFGMGTGLNVLLTFKEAKLQERTVFYHTIEKYPLAAFEIEALNLSELSECYEEGIFERIHGTPWEEAILLSENFTLQKQQADFRKFKLERKFDVVYFDAFAPEVQPNLWTSEMFSGIASYCNPGAILTTYSSKGLVRRNLESAGFSIEKLPGPPGKREFIRATYKV